MCLLQSGTGRLLYYYAFWFFHQLVGYMGGDNDIQVKLVIPRYRWCYMSDLKFLDIEIS